MANKSFDECADCEEEGGACPEGNSMWENALFIQCWNVCGRDQGVIYSVRSESGVLGMASVYLALMILTFFIPLVIYFSTCAVASAEKVNEREVVDGKIGVKPNSVLQPIHPVLRQNCAVARLVSQHDVNSLRIY